MIFPPFCYQEKSQRNTMLSKHADCSLYPKYIITEREALAVVWAVKKLHGSVEGREVGVASKSSQISYKDQAYYRRIRSMNS
ncbi:hypothetical protein CEXT_760641 [Caerostris extrusa]|uniref:Reverse transcriptase RNase H-like domain-containing protein n=1 Tax=Caerostris extrusa TaxID=172846 RepID=A0AAV4VZJ7_CAEEX|nr:hypothetical protein CEXT_760641 [Caerostris extrusa]